MDAREIKIGMFVMVTRPVQTCFGIIQAGTIGKVDGKRFGVIRVLVPTDPGETIWNGAEFKPRDLIAAKSPF